MNKLDECYQEVDEKLKEFLNKSKDIKRILVADMTGQLIDSKGRDTLEDEENTRMLAATFSAMIAAVGSAGEEGGLGDTATIYVQYGQGIVHISRIGKRGALALIAEPDANLGAVRLLARKYSERLHKPVSILSKHLGESSLKRASIEEKIPQF